MDFPPNSKKAQEGAQKPPKRVERVTSADAVRRKKGIGNRLKATFIAGDPKSAWDYVILNVLVPSAKDALAEATHSWIEKLVFGETRGRKRPTSPSPYGHVSYDRISRADDRPPIARTTSRRARARHDFDEIILDSRPEAEEVIERLFDIVDRYESATLGDLYELTGLESSHTDQKWGWTNLRGANVQRVRSGGYLLNLPDPEPLD